MHTEASRSRTVFNKMLFKVEAWIFLLLFVSCNARVALNDQQKLCGDCLEEVWEEVPCDSIDASSSTVTEAPPKPKPTSTTERPAEPSNSAIDLAVKPPSQAISATTGKSSTKAIESGDSYKKCYFECKSGCKEFCRKVVHFPDVSKQILHISKTTEPKSNGNVEVKQVLERNYIASQSSPIAYSNPYDTNSIRSDSNYETQQQPQPQEQKEKNKPEVQPEKKQDPKQEKAPQLTYVELPLPSTYNSNRKYGNQQAQYPPVEYSNLYPASPNYQLSNSPNYVPQSQPFYAAINGGPLEIPPYPLNSEQQYVTNSIPKPQSPVDYPNYVDPLPAYPNYSPQYRYVDAKASYSAFSSDDYKKSQLLKPEQSYVSSDPLYSLLPNESKYDLPDVLKSLKGVDPAIDSYLRHFIYSSPTKAKEYAQPQ